MVKFLLIVLALVAVVAAGNITEDTEVVRNARGICSHLSSMVSAAADAAAYFSTSGSSSSSSNSNSSGSECGSGDSYELIPLTPSRSGPVAQQVGGNSGSTRIPNYVPAAAYGGSNSAGGGSPHVTTRVVGQNVRQLGNGPTTSIREGPSHVVSGGGAPIYTSQPSQPAPVQPRQAPAPSAPVSNGQYSCCCCGQSNNAQQQAAPRQVEYVHVEHPPQIVEKIIEHHIEHPPQIIETVVETVVDHPPQVIEHTNHVVEQVPHVMIARGPSHQRHHQESSQRTNIADPMRIMKGNKF